MSSQSGKANLQSPKASSSKKRPSADQTEYVSIPKKTALLASKLVKKHLAMQKKRKLKALAEAKSKTKVKKNASADVKNKRQQSTELESDSVSEADTSDESEVSLAENSDDSESDVIEPEPKAKRPRKSMAKSPKKTKPLKLSDLMHLQNTAIANNIIWPLKSKIGSQSTVRTFFKRLEQIWLLAKDTQDQWVSILPALMDRPETKSWVTDNIVQKSLSWEEAKRAFTDQYEDQNYVRELLNEYDARKQLPREPIQDFVEVFLDYVQQLNLPDGSLLVETFLARIDLNLRHEYDRHVMLLKSGKRFDEVEELQNQVRKTANLCVTFSRTLKSATVPSDRDQESRERERRLPPSGKDTSERNSNKRSRSATPQSGSRSGSGSTPKDKNVNCEFHGLCSHTTEVCKVNPKSDNYDPDWARRYHERQKRNNNSRDTHQSNRSNSSPSSSSTPGGASTSRVRCNHCQEMGHYASHCPNRESSKSAVTDRKPSSLAHEAKGTGGKPPGTKSARLSSRGSAPANSYESDSNSSSLHEGDGQDDE
jgi:hypothetical protein